MRTTTTVVNTGDVEFDTAANSWLAKVQTDVMDAQVNKQRYHTLPPYVLGFEPPKKGQTFLRIWDTQGTGHQSAWAFIALRGGENKGMGVWKRGDIFKPDGWKKPARHARGNIFEPGANGLASITAWTGPNYLR